MPPLVQLPVALPYLSRNGCNGAAVECGRPLCRTVAERLNRFMKEAWF